MEVVNSSAEFPSLQLPQPIDLMSLLEADVGPIYKRIQEGDPVQKTYGYIPRMAHGVVGALNSEGFCERMLSAAGQVLTEGNTMLKDEEMEKLTLLRMNKKFMKFMRQHYSHLIRQQFNRTVVQL